MSTVEELLGTVVEGGYCIGCGACTAVDQSPIRIELDDDGCYQAIVDAAKGLEEPVSDPRAVCPFSDESENEDEIGRRMFATGGRYSPELGYYLEAYTGYVSESTFRALGSSGGMGKWILYELLRKNLVDGVIQIGARKPLPEDPMVYNYTVMNHPEEVLDGSKSVYYPVEMSDALAYIRDHPGRYAITGIPCFIKSLRLLAEQESLFKERIVFCVGVICGHLKSSRYADMIGWQFGIEPGDLESIDFRTKLPGARANEKGVTVRSIEPDCGEPKPDIVQNLYGTNYNHGFFQYSACNFCDDVVGETSDISIGDAWLDEYLPDGNGTNAVVVRHPEIHRLVEDAITDGRLQMRTVDADTIVESQAGGFRQRREGLAYRLYLADKKEVWRPQKRVAPKKYHITRKRRRIYELRMEMTERSHRAFRQALDQRDFEVFRRAMQPLLDAYRDLYRPSFWRRIVRGVQRRIPRIRDWIAGKREKIADVL